MDKTAFVGVQCVQELKTMPEVKKVDAEKAEAKAEALDDLRMYGDLLYSGINANDILDPKTLTHLGSKLIQIAEILSDE